MKKLFLMTLFGTFLLNIGCNKLQTEKEKEVYIEVEKDDSESTDTSIPMVDSLVDQPCNFVDEGKIIFLLTEGQTYKCIDTEWVSYEGEKRANLIKKLVGDWYSCFHIKNKNQNASVSYSAVETKVTFYNDGSITSGTAYYRGMHCRNRERMYGVDPFVSGNYQIKNDYTIFISNAFLDRDFYTRFFLGNDSLYLAIPQEHEFKSTEFEPYFRPFIKFEKADFKVEYGFKIYYEGCTALDGCPE